MLKCDACGRMFGGYIAVNTGVKKPDKKSYSLISDKGHRNMLCRTANESKIEYDIVMKIFGKTDFNICYPCWLKDLGVKPKE